MKSVLVTGGAGYIGSHICKLFASCGYLPIAFDNFITGSKSSIKFGPFFEGDICNYKDLENVFDKYKPEAVIHMAASIAVAESVDNPRKYYQNNSFGGFNLLNFLIDKGIKHIVYSSTAAVYGVPDKELIDENEDKKPINPYGKSKLFLEDILEDYAYSYGLKFVSLRYFNVAGADPEGQIGSTNKAPKNLIPILMDVQIGKKPFLEIYGNDYPTIDGTGLRDYIHVTDLARAHLLALNYLIKNGENNKFNLGSGKGATVKQVVDMVEQVTKKPVTLKYLPRRAGDPAALIADISRAKKILGWQPEISDLKTIIQTAWQWQNIREATLRVT